MCLLALSWAGWHGIVPSTKACQQDCFVAFFPKNPQKKNPYRVSRDAPVLRDEEESPRSAWRRFQQGPVAKDSGLAQEWLWLQEGEGKWSVLYGAGPGAPGLRDPSSAPVGSRREIRKSESKSCFFCDKSEVRAGRRGHRSQGLLSHPTKPGIGQGTAQGSRGGRNQSSSMGPEPGQPLNQGRRRRRVAAEAESSGSRSWMEQTVQDQPLQDCPSSVQGAGDLCQPQQPTPSSPRSWY